MSKPLSGIYAALMSGFADNGDFCSTRQNAIVDYVIRQRITGLYVGGSSAEGGLMTASELLEQQVIVHQKCKGSGKTLIAHVGLPSLKESIRLAQHAKACGYDGLSALPPHAYPFSHPDVLDYYRHLSAATDLPMIIYEVPIRTGRTSTTAQMVELLALKNVVGIKYTNTDLFGLALLRKHSPQATCFFGFDEMFGAAAALGVDGGIGTTYNIIGGLYTAIFAAAWASDIPRLQTLQHISRDFVEALLKVGVIPGMKLALQQIGVDCGSARAPFNLVGDNPQQIIRDALDKPDLREWLAPGFM